MMVHHVHPSHLYSGGIGRLVHPLLPVFLYIAMSNLTQEEVNDRLGRRNSPYNQASHCYYH